MIISIVSTYTSKGIGQRIFIIRDNRLTREYTYSTKNLYNLYILTEDWRNVFFPNSITINRRWE